MLDGNCAHCRSSPLRFAARYLSAQAAAAKRKTASEEKKDVPKVLRVGLAGVCDCTRVTYAVQEKGYRARCDSSSDGAKVHCASRASLILVCAPGECSGVTEVLYTRLAGVCDCARVTKASQEKQYRVRCDSSSDGARVHCASRASLIIVCASGECSE